MNASRRNWVAAPGFRSLRSLLFLSFVLLAPLSGCTHSDSSDGPACSTATVEVNTLCQTVVDCPGAGAPGANVTCSDSRCTFSCKGDAYDANGLPSDGCEVVDPVTWNHDESGAVDLGYTSCLDSSSHQDILGLLPSDARRHEGPSIDGFNAPVGAAADWYVIGANGGSCEDDIDFTIQIDGAARPDRYRMTVSTDKHSYDCTTDANGRCQVKDGSGSYTDETDVFIFVEKLNGGDAATCAPDATQYRITGHL